MATIADFKVGREFIGTTHSPWARTDGSHAVEISKYRARITSVSPRGGVKWEVVEGISVENASPEHNSTCEVRTKGGGWNVNVRMPDVVWLD